MNRNIETWVESGAAALAVLGLLYVLTAPPVMSRLERQPGFTSFPVVYRPMVRVIESDNGLALWYFEDVWQTGLMALGGESVSPLVMGMYALVGRRPSVVNS